MNFLKLLFVGLLLNACDTKETLKANLQRCALELATLEDRVRAVDPKDPFLCDIGLPRLARMIGKADECQEIIEKYDTRFKLSNDLIPLKILLKEDIQEKSLFYAELEIACANEKKLKGLTPENSNSDF